MAGLQPWFVSDSSRQPLLAGASSLYACSLPDCWIVGPSELCARCGAFLRPSFVLDVAATPSPVAGLLNWLQSLVAWHLPCPWTVAASGSC